MSRKYLYTLLTCLLCLFPLTVFTQSLTQCEYWFDDGFNSRKTIALSGKEDEIETMIDAGSLSSGVHNLFFRLKQSDGSYSAISSYRFSKFGLGGAKLLEYWFDGNLSDTHQLVGKTPSNDPDAIVFNDSIDCSKLAAGFHTVSVRVVSQDKQSSNSIFTKPFFKYVGLGNAKLLEYWFDNDRKKINMIEGHVSADNEAVIFNEDIDLNHLSPGHHRMYYRVVGQNGLSSSSVSSTSVIVKSKYDVRDSESLKVTEQAYWFDDEEKEVEYVANPMNISNIQYSFDARKLSEGKHVLHLRYGNSYGIWGATIDTTFTKENIIPPVIVVNSSVKDGIISFDFPTIPNGVDYSVIRKYPSGKIRLVRYFKDTEYPFTLKATDAPAPGTYTYYVKGKYTDVNGELKEVYSNDVSVTIDKAAESVKKATIHGVLKINGKVASYRSYMHTYFVYINGEEASSSKYSFHKGDYYSYGHFWIEDVPYGTEISIGVGIPKEGISSNLSTFIVSESTSNNTYYFDCTDDGEDGFIADNDAYDLILKDRVHITPNGWELSVKNRSAYKSWSGNIIVKVINKEAKEMYDKDSNGGLPWYYFILYANDVKYAPNYITVSDTPVKLQKRESKILTLNVTDLPKSTEEEEYYVYVFSKKDGTAQLKDLGDGGIGSLRNPQTLEFNPSDYGTAVIEGYKDYMKGYAEVMRYVKKLSEWGDPFKLAVQSVTNKNFELWVKNFEKGDVDIEELLKDETDVALTSAGLLLNCFSYDLHKAVKKYMNDFNCSYPALLHGKMQQLYNRVNDAVGVFMASEADDQYKFFELAKYVLKFSKELSDQSIFDPAFECYKTYFEVGEAMIKAIERLNTSISEQFVWDRLVTKNGVFKIKVRKYTDDNTLEYFSGQDVFKQIKDIKVILYPSTGENVPPLEMTSYEKEEDYNGITLKKVTFNDKGNTFYMSSQAWMKILWKNKRVTYVPLLDKNFVKLENFKKSVKEPLIITVELQSDTYLNVEGMANKLTFVKP